MQKVRLDQLLYERGLVESRSKAQAVIMAGKVRVEGQVVIRPAASVFPQVNLELEAGPRFVSRGGEKLEAALSAFRVVVAGCVAADVGSSTGGFTDCLLQHGADKVYAIDVGKGLLHWKLRTDPRVVVVEETNARFLEKLPEPVTLVTIDASFISLKLLLPVIVGWFPIIPDADRDGHANRGQVIALIKPQFEAGRKETARGEGVIRDRSIHQDVLVDILTFAERLNLGVLGLIRSPLTGPKGNIEFLAWFGLGVKPSIDLHPLISKILEST